MKGSAVADDDVDPLVTALTARRIYLGLTARQVAEAARLSTGSISEWERGRHTPNLTSLRRWAAALGVELETRA